MFNNFNMQRQEIEAEMNLANLSQVTNYIFQWQDRRPKNPQLRQKLKENATDYAPQQPIPIKHQRRATINREPSEKYDLKKWQKRVETINKIEFPIIGDNLFANEEHYILKKFQIKQESYLDQSTNEPQRKDGINKKIIQALEEEYIKKKLQKFRQRIEESRKKVFNHESTAKLKSLPKMLMNKKRSAFGKDNYYQQQKIQRASSRTEIQKLKKELVINKRKFSLPNLAKL